MAYVIEILTKAQGKRFAHFNVSLKLTGLVIREYFINLDHIKLFLYSFY